MATILFFKKLWTFVKTYWQIILLVAGSIVGVIFFGVEKQSFNTSLKTIQDAHDQQIKAIEAARDQEAVQHTADVKQLQDALSAVQKQYDAQEKALDDKKKAEIEQIVKQYGDKPDELAKQLSAATGFDIVLPTS
jgi:biopolymer transport protein ExbB/TolQ